MDEKNVKRLLDYLSKFGQAKFRPCDYSNSKEIKYARIEIITKQEIADGLIQEVNKQLSPKNGLQAFMRLIPLTCQENGKCKYAAEIVPYDYVPLDKKEKVTDQYIHRLPHVIKNYRKKNPSPSRKR
jgi:hypothetical protein